MRFHDEVKTNRARAGYNRKAKTHIRKRWYRHQTLARIPVERDSGDWVRGRERRCEGVGTATL